MIDSLIENKDDYVKEMKNADDNKLLKTGVTKKNIFETNESSPASAERFVPSYIRSSTKWQMLYSMLKDIQTVQTKQAKFTSFMLKIKKSSKQLHSEGRGSRGEESPKKSVREAKNREQIVWETR